MKSSQIEDEFEAVAVRLLASGFSAEDVDVLRNATPIQAAMTSFAISMVQARETPEAALSCGTFFDLIAQGVELIVSCAKVDMLSRIYTTATKDPERPAHLSEGEACLLLVACLHDKLGAEIPSRAEKLANLTDLLRRKTPNESSKGESELSRTPSSGWNSWGLPKDSEPANQVVASSDKPSKRSSRPGPQGNER